MEFAVTGDSRGLREKTHRSFFCSLGNEILGSVLKGTCLQWYTSSYD